MHVIRRTIAAAVIFAVIFLGIGLFLLSEDSGTLRIPILLYHHITEDGAGESTIAVATFLSHLDAIKGAGYQTITLEQLKDYVTIGRELPEKPILITFDDGYLSNYEIAWPALRERNMVASIFVVGSFVGQNTYKDSAVPIIPHFSYEQAREMVESGTISIQSHTFDMHQSTALEWDGARTCVLSLDGESNAEYEDALYWDFHKSIQAISANVGESVIALAYPLGMYTQRSEQVCSALDIPITLTTQGELAQVRKNDSDSLRLLGRFSIDDCTGAELLQMISEAPDSAVTNSRGKKLGYGDYCGSSYESSWKRNKINGDILNFYVNNKGTTSVIITINGENARTLEPGEAGHISAEVNDLLNLGKWYTVKCVPAISGADINITYAVAQRDST